MYRLPIWFFATTVGRFLSKKSDDDDDEAEDDDVADAATAGEEDDSEPGKATPSTDSNEEFELLDKSTDSLAKVTGSQPAGKGKSNKRKGRKK